MRSYSRHWSRRLADKVEELARRIDKIEASQKESEISILRALKTLVNDYRAYKDGEIDQFPESALWGVVFAYLRPRLVIVVASIAAVAIGSLQVWLLINQNRLLDQQNEFIDAQSRSDFTVAALAVLETLDEDSSELVAVKQLASLGGQGFELLYQLVCDRTNLEVTAAQALAHTSPEHSLPQFAKGFSCLSFASAWKLDDFSQSFDAWLSAGEEGNARERLEESYAEFEAILSAFQQYARLAIATREWDDVLPEARAEMREGVFILLRDIARFQTVVNNLSDLKADRIELDVDWDMYYDIDFDFLLDDAEHWCASDTLSSDIMEIDWIGVWIGISYDESREKINRIAETHCSDFNPFRPESG